MNQEKYISVRSFLASNVEVLLENISIRRNAKKIASDDLFGDESISSKLINWQFSHKPLSKINILLLEKESLGLYVSGNPLDDYLNLLSWVRETAGRDDIFIIVIDKIRKIFTKTNSMMFALEISIPEIEAEAIVFPKNALRISPILEEKEIFWVKGKIQTSRKNKAKSSQNETVIDEVEEVKENITIIENTEAEIKEYDELPKLIIDEIVRFEAGILPLFEGEEIDLAMHRKEILKKLDWQWLKSRPEEIEPVVKKSIPTIFLPMSLGPEKLAEIKSQLSKVQVSGWSEVKVEVQTSKEIKVVKDSFWVDNDILTKYKK